MNYRKDIQILRGLSVLLVVFFHLEFASMSSGFLGVDIFFVISGFLMAVLYQNKNKVEFFLKRAKRLLPAYFTTIFFSVLVAAIITIPNEFNSVVGQSIFATFFSSNVGFWLENSYFDKSAFKPLLHLWSLGVEIQYYAIVPLLFWCFNKSKSLLPFFLILSLISCFIVVGISPKTSFFITPFRVWEFLIGYIVAVTLCINGSVKFKKLPWLGALGLALILCIPLVGVGGDDLGLVKGHPGLFALFTSLATGLVLAFGLPKFLIESIVGSSIEKVGKYSYSIYLVHFPVIVFYLYEPFQGTGLQTTSTSQLATLSVIILILSISLHHLVEAPKFYSGNISLRLLAPPSLVLVSLALGFVYQQVTYSKKELLIFEAWNDRETYRCGKVIRILEPTAISCQLTTSITAPSKEILLVGNSHADSIKSTFSHAAESLNVSVRFLVPNNPLMYGGLSPSSLIKEAKSRGIDTIVLHYSPNTVEVSIIEELADLAYKNGISTNFLMPVPVWDRHIPKALWRGLKDNVPLPSQTITDYNNHNNKFHEALLNIPSFKLKIYDVGNLFCADKCSISSKEGKPYYFDSGHLTLTGSEVLREKLISIINQDASNLAQ